MGSPVHRRLAICPCSPVASSEPIGLPPSSLVDVNDRVRVCTEAAPLPPSPLPRKEKEAKDPVHHVGTGPARPDDAGMTRSTGPRQITGETIPGTLPSIPLPREEVLRTKRDAFRLDPKKHPRVSSFHDSTRLTDSQNDVTDVITKRFLSIEASLESPSLFGKWMGTTPPRDIIRLSVLSKSLTYNIRIFLDQTSSNLQRSLEDHTSGPSAFKLFLREFNLHYQSKVSSSNPETWTQSFKNDPGTTFSA